MVGRCRALIGIWGGGRSSILRGGEVASGGLPCGPAPPTVPSPGSLVYPVSAVRPSGKAFQPPRGVLLTERPSDASLRDTRRQQEAGRLRGLHLPLRWFGVWAPIITCAQSHNQSATTSEGPWGPSEPLLHLSTDFLSLLSRKPSLALNFPLATTVGNGTRL